ncbi:MAG: hypothetical protein AAB263_14300 [Planctomycetota bacterium]
MADAWDVGGIVGGVATLGGGLWGGLRWLIGRNDKRTADLDKKEAALIVRMEQRIKALEERDEDRERDHADCQQRVDKLLFFCVLMVEEGEAANSSSQTIRRAKMYLMRVFPEAFGPQPPIPKDMLSTLDKLG